MSDPVKPLVVITGVSGAVGEAVVGALRQDYRLIGLDRAGTQASVPIIPCDLTQDLSVRQAFAALRHQHGDAIASVVHLAGYYDFTGEDNPLYRTLNVEGTRRLMQALKPFRVEQIVYAGTMLVHKPVKPGEHLNEERELDPQWIYPESKAEAEAVIRAEHGNIPCVLLHLAGLYDGKTVVPTLAHQIVRIRERRLESHLYPGNRDTGQAMLHHADMADAFRRVVDRRGKLGPETVILIGEPDPMGYAALQDRLGELLHGEQWTTIRIPAAAAAAGAWAEETLLPHLPEALGGGKEPFIRPFMAWQGNDHYALDISRAKALLGWVPHHHLDAVLPEIIAALKRDPKGWYETNKID